MGAKNETLNETLGAMELTEDYSSHRDSCHAHTHTNTALHNPQDMCREGIHDAASAVCCRHIPPLLI